LKTAELTYEVVLVDFSIVDLMADDDLSLVDVVIIFLVAFNISCKNGVVEEKASDCVTGILDVVTVEAFVIIAVFDPSYVEVIFVLFENVNLVVVFFGNIEVNVIMEADCRIFKVVVRYMELFREVDVFCIVDFKLYANWVDSS